MATRVILNSSGLSVSKPGKSAASGDINDYLFSTAFGLTRRHLSGYFTPPSDFSYGSIVHNLGFIPMFYVENVTEDGTNNVSYADATYLYVSCNVQVRYTVFASPLGF